MSALVSLGRSVEQLAFVSISNDLQPTQGEPSIDGHCSQWREGTDQRA